MRIGRNCAVGLLLLSLCASVEAAPPAAEPPQAAALLQAARTIGLSPTQLAQIKKLVLASESEFVGTQGKLKVTQLDLEDANASATPPTEKRLVALIDQAGKLQTQLEKNRALLMLRIRVSLGKAQWEKMQAALAQGGPVPAPAAKPRPTGMPYIHLPKITTVHVTDDRGNRSKQLGVVCKAVEIVVSKATNKSANGTLSAFADHFYMKHQGSKGVTFNVYPKIMGNLVAEALLRDQPVDTGRLIMLQESGQIASMAYSSRP